jgi:hypothetical protein
MSDEQVATMVIDEPGILDQIFPRYTSNAPRILMQTTSSYFDTHFVLEKSEKSNVNHLELLSEGTKYFDRDQKIHQFRYKMSESPRNPSSSIGAGFQGIGHSHTRLRRFESMGTKVGGTQSFRCLCLGKRDYDQQASRGVG